MNEIELISDSLNNIKPTDNIFNDSCLIIDTAQVVAYRAVNAVLVQRNWLLGQRIEQEILQGGRADHGENVITKLADELTARYGKGFDYSTLYKYAKFFKMFPDILDSVSTKSRSLLSWTHYRVLLQVDNEAAREWYAKESLAESRIVHCDGRFASRSKSDRYNSTAIGWRNWVAHGYPMDELKRIMSKED